MTLKIVCHEVCRDRMADNVSNDFLVLRERTFQVIIV